MTPNSLPILAPIRRIHLCYALAKAARGSGNRPYLDSQVRLSSRATKYFSVAITTPPRYLLSAEWRLTSWRRTWDQSFCLMLLQIWILLYFQFNLQWQFVMNCSSFPIQFKGEVSGEGQGLNQLGHRLQNACLHAEKSAWVIDPQAHSHLVRYEPSTANWAEEGLNERKSAEIHRALRTLWSLLGLLSQVEWGWIVWGFQRTAFEWQKGKIFCPRCRFVVGQFVCRNNWPLICSKQNTLVASCTYAMESMIPSCQGFLHGQLVHLRMVDSNFNQFDRFPWKPHVLCSTTGFGLRFALILLKLSSRFWCLAVRMGPTFCTFFRLSALSFGTSEKEPWPEQVIHRWLKRLLDKSPTNDMSACRQECTARPQILVPPCASFHAPVSKWRLKNLEIKRQRWRDISPCPPKSGLTAWFVLHATCERKQFLDRIWLVVNNMFAWCEKRPARDCPFFGLRLVRLQLGLVVASVLGGGARWSTDRMFFKHATKQWTSRQPDHNCADPCGSGLLLVSKKVWTGIGWLKMRQV